jgi:hypothetical protein
MENGEMSDTDSGVTIPFDQAKRAGPRLIQPNERMTVVLEAGAWEAVMRALNVSDAPSRIVAPLIAEIQRQCQAQASREDYGSSA